MIKQTSTSAPMATPPPETLPSLAVATSISPPVFKPLAIVGLSQLRVHSQVKRTEQQSFINAERSADGTIVLGKVLEPDTAFTINIYPDPQRPEVKPQAIAAMLFKHVQNGPPSAEELNQVVQKFVAWRLDRFLNLEDFGYDVKTEGSGQLTTLAC
jgi:hypothetical protein